MADFIRCPSPRASLPELDEFGISYNAYVRVAAPERLLQVVRPVIRAIDQGKGVPEWAGIDLVRAALFFVHRRGHFSGPSPELEASFRLLVARISELAAGEPLVRDKF